MGLNRASTIPNRTALNVQVLISCSSDAPKGHVKGTADLDCGLPNPSTLFSLKTLNALTTGLIERADSDANMYPTNPDLSLNITPNLNPNVSVTTNSNASAIANSNSNTSTGVSTRTKVTIAVTIVVGIALAVAIALCRFTVNRKLQKSKKEKDEEEFITNEEHSVAKDGSKLITISTAETSLDTTLQMTSLGLEEIPKPLRSHKSTNFRPVTLVTPIELATESSPLPINFFAATPGGNTNVNGVQDSETVEEELDRRGRGRLGQDLDRADTAHGSLEPIEFTNPFERTKSLKAPNLDDRESIIPSPTTQIPELTRKKPISQPPRLQLDLRCTSLDSRCLLVSSQPPRLQLHLACSSANSSQTSLVEGSDCAVAESSSIQRLKPAVVHVRTPSPRTSGGFGAHYGCDPRLSRVMTEADRRNLSV